MDLRLRDAAADLRDRGSRMPSRWSPTPLTTRTPSRSSPTWATGGTASYRAGWLRDGIVCAAQLGTAGYLSETPQRRLFTEYWNLAWDGKLIEAMDYARTTGLPVGSYPHSRPPQALLPDPAKTQIRDTYRRLGLLED